MSIGSMLDELLYNKRVSQKQMSEDLSISSSSISNYIRDYREPDVDTLKILASYFAVTLDYLLEFNVSTEDTTGKELTENEQNIVNIFRCLTKEQQGYLVEQGKMYINTNSKKTHLSSDTTLPTGTEKNR